MPQKVLLIISGCIKHSAMKKTAIVIMFGYLISCYTSCITSLHPLVTAENITTEKQVEGHWMSKDMEFTVIRTPDSLITRIIGVQDYPNRKNDSIQASQAYYVTCQKDGIRYDFQLALTQLNGNLFMHLASVGFEPKIDNITWVKKHAENLAYLPTYTIAKLQISNSNMLVIKFVNGQFIKEQVQAGKVMIKYEKDELFDMFLITASSEELQQFLRKYGNDERLYSQNGTVILKRKDASYVSKKSMDQ